MPVLKAWDGTQWVEVAGGTEEVHVGPDAPTLSAVELWYDTDAIPTLDIAKLPRGLVANVTVTTGTTTAPTVTWTAITGASIPFTPTNGRIYDISLLVGSVVKTGAVGEVYLGLFQTAGQLAGVASSNVAVGQLVPGYLHRVWAPGAIGSTIITGQLYIGVAGGGTITPNAQYPLSLTIEDIGGV